MDLGAVMLALFTGLVVKLAVMAVSTWLVVKVYGATRPKPPRRLWLVLPNDSLPTVRILWWSLFLFAVSELTCGVEAYVLFRSSVWISGIHAFTSAAGMGLFSLGLYRLVDEKILHFGEPRCAVKSICHTCTLRAPEGCRFRLTVLLVATLVALAAIVPMFASTARMVGEPQRYLLPLPKVNGFYDQHVVPWLRGHFASYRSTGEAFELQTSVQIIEYRIIPAIAAAIAALGIWRAQRGEIAPASRTTATAAGVLGYSYFDLVLHRGTGDLLLATLLHEVGEFWFLLFTIELLRRSFPLPPATAA